MKFFGRKGEPASELDRLLQGRPNFKIVFSKSQVAAALWDYGEDNLAARAIAMSDEDLAKIRAIAAWCEDPNYLLRLTGQHITRHHVNAFAAITLFEGRGSALDAVSRSAAEEPTRGLLASSTWPWRRLVDTSHRHQEDLLDQLTVGRDHDAGRGSSHQLRRRRPRRVIFLATCE